MLTLAGSSSRNRYHSRVAFSTKFFWFVTEQGPPGMTPPPPPPPPQAAMNALVQAAAAASSDWRQEPVIGCPDRSGCCARSGELGAEQLEPAVLHAKRIEQCTRFRAETGLFPARDDRGARPRVPGVGELRPLGERRREELVLAPDPRAQLRDVHVPQRRPVALEAGLDAAELHREARALDGDRRRALEVGREADPGQRA